ncbi:hypothetical protein BJ912DRAFT_1039409 [Pholiota molesta]|nr:hypothetical protein BJ912DRAFT_1039409 [Pholiota molesta]
MAPNVILEDLRSTNADYYFAAISISIAVYEYCLTFVSEVERFWTGGPLNCASGLFYMNRYLVLFGHIPVMIEFFWATSNPAKIKELIRYTSQICQKLQSYHQFLAIAIQVIVASMLVMRMYALYERSRRVLALYLVVCTIVVAIGLSAIIDLRCALAVFLLFSFFSDWAVIGGKSQKSREVLLPVGCGAHLTHYQAIRLGAAWAGMLAFDSLVFGMTLYKSLTLARTPGVDLLTILLRDGAVYFAVMMAANLGNILTFVFGGTFTRGVATTFCNVISSVMISRLMLNLRDPALVRHALKSSTAGGEYTTYPNLTMLSTAQWDWEGDAQGGGGVDVGGAGGSSRTRGMDVYGYLATGESSRNGTGDVEMQAFKLEDRPEAPT